MNNIQYLCPKCNNLIGQITINTTCQKCGNPINFYNGALKLSNQTSYWNVLSPDLMEKLLDDSKKHGWKDAILKSDSQDIKDQYLFTDCPSRADGTFYMPIGKNSTILDLGSGFGSYTFAISPRVGSVIAADSNLESLEFISLRAKQENKKNIQTVFIKPLDYGKILFDDAQFDGIIMNGVLEWVGSFLKKGDPLKMQKKCLKEVFRILKPGGSVFIGIENRFGLRYFEGERDDHLKYYALDKKISYTTLLPRFIASIITRKHLGIPYRTYTHSLFGLKRLLNRSGFKKTEFYFPVSDYRAVTTKIFPIECNETKQDIQRRISNKYLSKIVNFLKLEKTLCDSYFVIAHKS